MQYVNNKVGGVLNWQNFPDNCIFFYFFPELANRNQRQYTLLYIELCKYLGIISVAQFSDINL